VVLGPSKDPLRAKVRLLGDKKMVTAKAANLRVVRDES